MLIGGTNGKILVLNSLELGIFTYQRCEYELHNAMYIGYNDNCSARRWGCEMKILLVEDEVITAMDMKNRMQGVGYTVTNHVVTGEEAVDSVRSNPPDLILMDIRLADDMDGIEAMSIIKSEHDIPFVFMTGYDEDAMKERAEKLNPLGYFIKPVEFQKLKILLDNHFGNGARNV